MNTASNRIDKPLIHCGWKPGRSAGQWVRKTSRGTARLTPRIGSGNWQQFVVKGGSLDEATANSVLTDNCKLYGPAKFVTGEDGLYCRVDLPTEFDSWTRDCLDGSTDRSRHDPYHCWAVGLTAIVTGQTDRLETPSIPETTVFALREAGWSAAAADGLQDDGRLDVHIHMPGLFRAIRIEPQDPPGLKAATDLLCLNGVDELQYQAIERIAAAANRRLPLVRFAIDRNSEPQVLRAEVHMGCASIPSGWLSAALEVVELAISLTARELQALWDRELVHLVLAADVA